MWGTSHYKRTSYYIGPMDKRCYPTLLIMYLSAYRYVPYRYIYPVCIVSPRAEVFSPRPADASRLAPVSRFIGILFNLNSVRVQRNTARRRPYREHSSGGPRLGQYDGQYYRAVRYIYIYKIYVGTFWPAIIILCLRSRFHIIIIYTSCGGGVLRATNKCDSFRPVHTTANKSQ